MLVLYKCSYAILEVAVLEVVNINTAPIPPPSHPPRWQRLLKTYERLDERVETQRDTETRHGSFEFQITAHCSLLEI